MKIGFFDSGLGGLSVLHAAFGMLSCNSYIYYADEKNVPYGEKPPEQIVQFTDNAVDFMIKKGAEAIVIACNTATSCAIGFLRQKYGDKIPIVGMEPAVKLAIEKYNKPGKRVLITATPVTVRRKKLTNLIERVDVCHAADTLALPELVRFAERLEFESHDVAAYISEKLSAFNLEEYSSLVLGCTHFNYFKDTFARLLPAGVKLVDGGEGTIRQLARLTDVSIEKPIEKTFVEYYFSGTPCTPDELSHIKLLHERLEAMQGISCGTI